MQTWTDDLINAVAENCDTANLDRQGATESVIQALRKHAGKTLYCRNESTGEGVKVVVSDYSRAK